MASYLPLGSIPEKTPLDTQLKIVGKIQADSSSRKKSSSSGKEFVHLQFGDDKSDVIEYIPIKVKELAQVLNKPVTELRKDIKNGNIKEINQEINNSFRVIIKSDGEIELVRNQKKLYGPTLTTSEQAIPALGKGKPVGPKKNVVTNPDKIKSYHLKQTVTGITEKEAHEIALLKSSILKSDFDEYFSAGHTDLSPKDASAKYVELKQLKNEIKKARDSAANSVIIKANSQGITEQNEIDKLVETKKRNFDKRFEENPWKVIKEIDKILIDLKHKM